MFRFLKKSLRDFFINKKKAFVKFRSLKSVKKLTVFNVGVILFGFHEDNSGVSLRGESVDDGGIDGTELFGGARGKLLNDIDVGEIGGEFIVENCGLSNDRSGNAGAILIVGVIGGISVQGVVISLKRLQRGYISGGRGNPWGNVILETVILGLLIHLKCQTSSWLSAGGQGQLCDT